MVSVGVGQSVSEPSNELNEAASEASLRLLDVFSGLNDPEMQFLL